MNKVIALLFCLIIICSCSNRPKTSDYLLGTWKIKSQIPNSVDSQTEILTFSEQNIFKHELIGAGQSKMVSIGNYKMLKDSHYLYTTLDNLPVKFKLLKLTADTLELFAEESKHTLVLSREE